jgi:cbb3-type cytochrome oxidase subunit 1
MMLGVAGGMLVGLSGRFAFMTVHSHLSLVGWTTMALTGLVYVTIPACAASRLAAVHFWLHNIGLPIMVAGLAALAAGEGLAEPFVALGSAVVIVGLAAFTANVFRNAGPASHGLASPRAIERSPATAPLR